VCLAMAGISSPSYRVTVTFLRLSIRHCIIVW
jgi:hypothetical protein